MSPDIPGDSDISKIMLTDKIVRIHVPVIRPVPYCWVERSLSIWALEEGTDTLQRSPSYTHELASSVVHEINVHLKPKWTLSMVSEPTVDHWHIEEFAVPATHDGIRLQRVTHCYSELSVVEPITAAMRDEIKKLRVPVPIHDGRGKHTGLCGESSFYIEESDGGTNITHRCWNWNKTTRLGLHDFSLPYSAPLDFERVETVVG